jgi:hypothetical protein
MAEARGKVHDATLPRFVGYQNRRLAARPPAGERSGFDYCANCAASV